MSRIANLYVVNRKNDVAPQGQYWELTEDGWEQVVMQQTRLGAQPAGYTGVILPPSALLDCVIRVQQRGQGIDENGLQRERIILY